MLSETFQKRVSHALEGLEGILNITHDILVYRVGDNEKEARVDRDRKLEALLNRCRERGMALNKNKLKLCISEVSFMSHIFSKEGLKIDPDKVKAVLEMPSHEDVEGVQRLLKWLCQLSSQVFPPDSLTKWSPYAVLQVNTQSSNGQKNKRRHYKKSNA